MKTTKSLWFFILLLVPHLFIFKGQAQDQKLQSFTQYDFVPGDEILFYDDFSQDAIGDFPALWTTNGNGAVRTLNIAPGQWFYMEGDDAVYSIINPIPFPDNFIVEFDLMVDDEFMELELTLYEGDETIEMNPDLYPGLRGLQIWPCSEDEGGWRTKGFDQENWFEGGSEKNPIISGELNHVIIWIQNRRVRIYHKGEKVLDGPTTIVKGTKFNRLRFCCWDSESKPFLSNLQISTAAPDTRSKLITEGKLISYGIYFDSGKDLVKPESYGTLNDIAKVLKENPGVRVKIVGHTDSDGDEAMNLDLSRRRAESVKSELIKTFNADAAMLETDGAGESQSLASNASSEGKAKNRRVEFIKL
ncbi:MAG: OmpA family protein [Bacteroidales bacterium]|nr:OmpA family protein [Bacteroidales bacterium]MCF8377510.1 OmpA family protein [Bacteroidales bacterium]MCF8401823.1 OmpA family protein [Bacteroidales bacterium]